MLTSEVLVWLVPAIISGCIGFYVLGQWREALKNQKEATQALHKRIDRITRTLARAGIDVPRDTQAGPDGRGVKVPR